MIMLTLTTLLLASTAFATPHIGNRGWNDWTASASSSKISTTTRSASSSTINSYSSSNASSQSLSGGWPSASSGKASVTIIRSDTSVYKHSPATTTLADYPVPSGYVLVKGNGICDGASISSSGSSIPNKYGTYDSGISSGSGSSSGAGHASGTLPSSFDSAPVTNLLKPAVHWDIDISR